MKEHPVRRFHILAAAAAMACTAAIAPRHADAQEFAPYIDMSLANSELLASSIQPQSGVKTFTLAFMVAQTNSKTGAYECGAAWGGIDPTGGDGLYDGSTIQQVVSAVRKNGGNVIISFGGAAGEDVALACTTAKQLAAVYQSVVTRYSATSLDFDIETYAELDGTGAQTSITLRNKAILLLKAANPGLKVSFTLPVAQTGLLADAYHVLTSAKADGLDPDVINIMAMSYGVAQTTGQMLTDAETAAKATAKQIKTAKLTSSLGITPMIGVNNYAGQPVETFTLADASKLLAFARATPSVSRIAMWSIGRDQQCPPNTVGAQPTCSGVAQSPYAFSKIFETPPTASSVRAQPKN
jgi:chitinase